MHPHDVAKMEELIRRARAGDVQAWGKLLEDYRGELRTAADRQIEGRLQARLDASDVVQQTLFEAHRAIGGFRGTTQQELAAWLRAILAHNIAGAIRDHTRLKKRAVARERPLDNAPNASGALANLLAAATSSPSQCAMRTEEEIRLTAALDTLPADQREAVRLRHLEARSLAEIAERFNRTPAAAASLIKRGMRQLREALDAQP